MLVLDGAETSGYRGVAGQWRLGVGLVVKGGGAVSQARDHGYVAAGAALAAAAQESVVGGEVSAMCER